LPNNQFIQRTVMAVFTGITLLDSTGVRRRSATGEPLCFYRRNRSTTNASGNPNCTRTCGHTCRTYNSYIL
jgi:hypothetical protein